MPNNCECRKIVILYKKSWHTCVLIIILWQSTLPQRDNYDVLQERTMNVNEQFMNIIKQVMSINTNYDH